MIWSLILNPPDPNLWVQKCKKGRHALLSQISYCALQLRLLHPTAPIIFWMNFSVFLSQKNWYAMGCQESESVGSYCVEMSLIDGCDQTLTKKSPSKYLQVFQTQSFLFLWNQLFFFFYFFFPPTESCLALPHGFIFCPSVISAGWLLCQADTMKTFFGASPSLLPIERVLGSP